MTISTKLPSCNNYNGGRGKWEAGAGRPKLAI